MVFRAHGGIGNGSIGNFQGTQKFYRLNTTKRIIKRQSSLPCPCRKHHADYHCSWGAGLDESRKTLKRMLKQEERQPPFLKATAITTRNFSTTINNNITQQQADSSQIKLQPPFSKMQSTYSLRKAFAQCIIQQQNEEVMEEDACEAELTSGWIEIMGSRLIHNNIEDDVV
eukprot:scaffold2892_cov91-Skeletonema_dohrnii-CCMP3373.AAC.1